MDCGYKFQGRDRGILGCGSYWTGGGAFGTGEAEDGGLEGCTLGPVRRAAIEDARLLYYYVALHKLGLSRNVALSDLNLKFESSLLLRDCAVEAFDRC